MTSEANNESAHWDREADVVVLGSGGAAMTAAITAHYFFAKDVVVL
jgi:3-oxosteroid 1-dehydrogenase